MNKTMSNRILGTLLLHCSVGIAGLFSTVSLAQEYPPTGERLRILADRADFQIGYASRFNFREQTFAEVYEDIVKAEFNIVTPENSVKWENVHPMPDTYDFVDMDSLVQFAEQNNMVLHGHPLLWYNQNPEWLTDAPQSSIEQIMLDHIDTVVNRYAEKIKVWDVVNEALEDTHLGGGYRDNVWLQGVGESYVEKAFVQAHASDPTASLIYNDYDVGWFTPKGQEMYVLVKDLVDRGIPIHGVGFQMHIGVTFEEYEEFSSNMQRYADLGLDIYITEFDVKTFNAEEYPAQAEVYEEIIRRCLAQPRCKALQIWGIDDFNSWQPFFDPLPFDDDFNIKPAYYGMQRGLSIKVLHAENHLSPQGVTIEAGTVQPISSGSSIRFAEVDLTAGYQSLTVRYANGSVEPSSLEVRLDSVDGPLLASVEVPRTGSAILFDTVDIGVAAVTGVHDLFVVFNTGSQSFKLDYLLLNPEIRISPVTAPTGGDIPDGDQGGGGLTAPASLVLLFFLCLFGRHRRSSRVMELTNC